MKVASIGVAGERGVKYACVVNDLHRAAGRSGVGAVMGSKNLKAIGVRGTKGVTVDNVPAFKAAADAGKQRVWNLERQFNLSAGLTRADDTLPPRMLREPAPAGFAKGQVCGLESMLNEYYAVRGWDANGAPTADTLERLGLRS